MTERSTLQANYFEALYAADRDPWGFETSAYEREKYARTVSAVSQFAPRRVLEVGCSIGVLTQQIAGVCGSVLSIDGAETALEQACVRCRDLSNVTLQCMQIPDAWPDGYFDLILLSEILYYLSDADLSVVATRARSSLEPDARLVLVHYVKPTNYPNSGDRAVELFIQAGSYNRMSGEHTDDYRIDVLTL